MLNAILINYVIKILQKRFCINYMQVTYHRIKNYSHSLDLLLLLLLRYWFGSNAIFFV